jgi:filamentous hemagglutinin family protein
VFLVAALLPAAASAQNITIDGRLSAARTLTGPNYAITPGLGSQVGGNLFQSFGIFNLASGETATFSGPASVTNIIGRVTGGTASSINGTIQSTVPGATLFLINPSGIVFGPNAQTNVSGGFHATTADYLKMADGARFQATNPDASTLSAAPPAAFGFTSVAPTAITVNGSSLGPVNGTLGLVGGAVTVHSAMLNAPSGTVHIAAAAGPAEVPVDPTSGAPVALDANFQPTTAPALLGPVVLSGGTVVQVGTPAASGGSVFIRAGALSADATQILANTYGAANGGQVLLQGNTSISLTGSTSVQAATNGSGSGTAVTLLTGASGNATIDNAAIFVGSVASGTGGSLRVNVGSLTMSDGAQLNSSTQSGGAAGSVSVVAGTVTITSAAAINTTTSGSGGGGPVSMNISGGLTIDGTATPAQFTGISANALAGATGPAGGVNVVAGSVSIAGSGGIYAITYGQGAGGVVGLEVTGGLVIDGTAAPANYFSGIAASTVAPSGGPAGNVTVSAHDVQLLSGAIFANTLGGGNGGTVTLNVVGGLLIDGSATPQNFSGISTDTFAPSGGGRAGQATVVAGNIDILASGAISSSTKGDGSANDVLVAASGDLSIDATGSTLVTGIASQTYPNSTGNAGNAAVSAANLSITGGGVISSSTYGTGIGGNVAVVVPGDVTLGSGGRIASASAEFGAAGQITVSAGQLMLTGGAAISTEASSANGGGITVNVGGLVYLNHASILTSVDGADGNSGNIVIDPQFIVLDAGQIRATAFAGKGGNISLADGLLLLSQDSVISATSPYGVSGTIQIAAPQPNVVGGLVVLASALRAAPVVLDEACARAGPAGLSHLVTSGPGSTHTELDSTLPALYIADLALHDLGTQRAANAASAWPAQPGGARRCG